MMHKCCHIGQAGDNCNKPAEWTIVYGPMPDDYTESCTRHVGDMLTDSDEHRVYPLKDDTASTSNADQLINDIITGIYDIVRYPEELRQAQATAATNSDARRFLEYGKEWRERALRDALRRLIEKTTQ